MWSVVGKENSDALTLRYCKLSTRWRESGLVQPQLSSSKVQSPEVGSEAAVGKAVGRKRLVLVNKGCVGKYIILIL